MRFVHLSKNFCLLYWFVILRRRSLYAIDPFQLLDKLEVFSSFESHKRVSVHPNFKPRLCASHSAVSKWAMPIVHQIGRHMSLNICCQARPRLRP